MQNLLFTLFAQYNIVSNNVNLVDKVTVIKNAFSLNEENIQLFFIGILVQNRDLQSALPDVIQTWRAHRVLIPTLPRYLHL